MMRAIRYSSKLFVVLVFLSAGTKAEDAFPDRVGYIYSLGKVEGTPLFIQKTHYSQDSDGVSSVHSTIVETKGKLVLSETASFRGTHLLSQKVEQLQTGHLYTIVSTTDKILFKDQETTKNKKLIEDEVDYTDDFITGPTTQAFLLEHWDELLSGKTVHCRFGVLEAQETFGFNFRMKRKEVLKERELVVISMKPSSFFNGILFSLMEGDIEIYIDPNTKRYVRYKGITPVQKVDEHGKLHRFSAEIIYE